VPKAALKSGRQTAIVLHGLTLVKAAPLTTQENASFLS
jgi:hypothetical protein